MRLVRFQPGSGRLEKTMNRIFQAFVFLLLIAGFGILAPRAYSQARADTPLTLTIKANKSVYEVGEPILVTLTIKNVSHRKISVNFTGLQNTFLCGDCDIINSKKIKLSWGAKIQPPLKVKSDYVVLKPGQRLSYEVSVYDGMFKRLVEDFYTIRCSYLGTNVFFEKGKLQTIDYDWAGTVVSNQIAIQVKPRSELPAIKNAWRDLLTALRSGDESRIQKLSTRNGFLYLSMNEAGYKKIAQRWSGVDLRWKFVTDSTAWAAYGPALKEPGIGFVKVDGAWKFDHVTAGE